MRHRRRLSRIAVFAAIAVLSVLDHAGVFGHRRPDQLSYHNVSATVTYAADGDTIDVDISDGDQPVTRIRLWGVDCPEIAHAKGEEDAHYGREASEFVRREIVGRRVRLEFDPNRSPRDKYGRLLAYVSLEESGEMVNEILIRRGLAYADRRFGHVFKHRFVQLEKKAIKNRIGLWASVTQEQMPAWRQRMDAAGAR